MNRISEIVAKTERVVVGLMSGTSVDGVDAALCRIVGSGLDTELEILAFNTYPYSKEVKERIHRLFSGHAKEICEMNFVLGELFAKAVKRIADEAGFPLSEVDLIGSPGQTIYHIPESVEGINSTLQIGEASVIAERTGIVTVCDFRTRDVAAGGAGAPLVPYADYLLFSHTEKVRALQNIGGIANVTVLPKNPDEIIAFDTGPGNMVIDEVARVLAKDGDYCDEDGKLSALGKVDEKLLKILMGHAYLQIPPPKTTGRETFGAEFTKKLLKHYDPLKLLDLLATVNRFTAESIRFSYEEYIFPRHKVDEVICSGGGVHNQTLMAELRKLFDPIPVRVLEDLGLSSDAKEAVAFAILANETIQGNPGNVPSATGARRVAVLGKIVP
jgi:anhydro-N-acetylmuramic acid kinase